MAEYAFILEGGPLPSLKAPEQWFDEVTQKRRIREGSDKAFAWLQPFMHRSIAALAQLATAHKWGPNSAAIVLKELRALIRDRRKVKQPYDDLLRALYGSALMADLAESLKFEGMPVHTMAGYVAMEDLAGIKFDYSTIGYRAVTSLGKTDVKWLVDAFGEPTQHQAVDVVWTSVRQNAIRRYCWGELTIQNDAKRSLGLPEVSMREWLFELVERNIGYHKEWQARCAEAEAQVAERVATLEGAWAATQAQFVVADVETTGLKAETAELLELAAIIVDPDGTTVSEFEVLVRPENGIPDEIAKLTGISADLVQARGKALDVALEAFLTYADERPVFFHNAPFDKAFLNAAAKRVRKEFKNPVHDTLPLAREAWPALRAYRLAALAEYVGARTPSHRALADARATLDVLLAARRVVRATSASAIAEHLGRQ